MDWVWLSPKNHPNPTIENAARRAAMVAFHRNENCRYCEIAIAPTLQLQEMGDLFELMHDSSNQSTHTSFYSRITLQPCYQLGKDLGGDAQSISIASTCSSTHLGSRGPRSHRPRTVASVLQLSAATSTRIRGKLLG